jgi:hypothetical protein
MLLLGKVVVLKMKSKTPVKSAIYKLRIGSIDENGGGPGARLKKRQQKRKP